MLLNKVSGPIWFDSQRCITLIWVRVESLWSLVYLLCHILSTGWRKDKMFQSQGNLDFHICLFSVQLNTFSNLFCTGCSDKLLSAKIKACLIMLSLDFTVTSLHWVLGHPAQSLRVSLRGVRKGRWSREPHLSVGAALSCEEGRQEPGSMATIMAGGSQ